MVQRHIRRPLLPGDRGHTCANVGVAPIPAGSPRVLGLLLVLTIGLGLAAECEADDVADPILNVFNVFPDSKALDSTGGGGGRSRPLSIFGFFRGCWDSLCNWGVEMYIYIGKCMVFFGPGRGEMNVRGVGGAGKGFSDVTLVVDSGYGTPGPARAERCPKTAHSRAPSVS